MTVLKKIIPLCSLFLLSTFAQAENLDLQMEEAPPEMPAQPNIETSEEKVNAFINSEKANDSQKQALMELISAGRQDEAIKIIDQMNEIKETLELLPKETVETKGQELSTLFAAVDQVIDGNAFIEAVDALHAAVTEMPKSFID